MNSNLDLIKISLGRGTLFIIIFYLLFNYGMQVVSFAGAPIAEIVLLIGLIALHPLRLFIARLSLRTLTPFIIWWVAAFTHLIFEVFDYGFWAMRDASHAIESLYILVGASLALKDVHYLTKRMEIFFWLVIGYGATYPFRDVLQSISPYTVGPYGQSISLLGSYINTPLLLLLASSYFLINTKNILLPIILICFTVVAFQTRTIYLQLLAIILFYSFVRPSQLGRIGFGLVGALTMLILLPVSGVQIEGRLGHVADFDFVIRQVMAIFGVSSAGLENAVEGNIHRMQWFADVYVSWSSSFQSTMFGLGYGEPLIDYVLAGGVIVREPHNSILTEIARLGVFGGGAMILAQIMLFRMGLKTRRVAKELFDVRAVAFVEMTILYSILLWIFSITEDGMQKPFNAISYYFLWGVVLRIRMSQFYGR